MRRVDGAPTRTRTADLLITNQLLYQLSYRGTAFRLLAYTKRCATGQEGQIEKVYSSDFPETEAQPKHGQPQRRPERRPDQPQPHEENIC